MRAALSACGLIDLTAVWRSAKFGGVLSAVELPELLLRLWVLMAASLLDSRRVCGYLAIFFETVCGAVSHYVTNVDFYLL